MAMSVFLRFLSLFGYGRPEQIAVRRMLALYEVLCAGRAEEDAAFWRDSEYIILSQ
jgi:cytochrome b pre-mRNA-processing protein 3